MSHHFAGRAVIASLLGILAMSLGCDDRPPSQFNPLAANPSISTPPAALTVTAVSPQAGLIGDSVRIAGTGFLQGATLTLDGIAAKVTAVNSGAIVATAPTHAVGIVDVVVTNPDGQSAALSRAFTYEVVSLTASQTVVAPGAPLTVSWTAPKGRSSSDWLGLFKVGDPNTAYDDARWQYTNGAASGTVTVSAPSLRGDYEFRYLLNDDYVDVARSSTVTVR